MSIHKITNIFTPEQIEHLHQIIDSTEIPLDENGEYISYVSEGIGICKDLGRLQFGSISNKLKDDIIYRLRDIVAEITDIKLDMSHAVGVVYSNKYGKPNLPPHRDGDTNDLIINFQLEANTSWDLGLNFETYSLEDNSALIFNGNTEMHWRVHKDFQDGEFVKMIFIRFYKVDGMSDYTHLNINPPDEIFYPYREFRDSLRSKG
jgi:hypothetical protein